MPIVCHKKKEITFPNIKIFVFTSGIFICSPEEFFFTNNEDTRICLLKVTLFKRVTRVTVHN